MVATRGLSYHQGDRSEYLVQYALSSIAAVVPVIRQEDYGVDFFCNLTTQNGHSLVIGPAFGLQAKSTSEREVTYGVVRQGKKKNDPKPEEIDWLYSQDNPLFFTSVDKDNLVLKIYSTSRIWRPYWREGPPKKTTLVFDLNQSDGEPDSQPYASVRDTDNMPTTTVPLGEPVILIDLKGKDSEDRKVCEDLRACMQYWIDLERKNITNNKLGIPCFYESLKWTTNAKPAQDDEAIFHAFNASPNQNIGAVVRSISPGLTNLAYNLIAQNQISQLNKPHLEALIPTLELLKTFNTPDRNMIEMAIEAARASLAGMPHYGPMQIGLSTRTSGGTGSLSGSPTA